MDTRRAALDRALSIWKLLEKLLDPHAPLAGSARAALRLVLRDLLRKIQAEIAGLEQVQAHPARRPRCAEALVRG